MPKATVEGYASDGDAKTYEISITDRDGGQIHSRY